MFYFIQDFVGVTEDRRTKTYGEEKREFISCPFPSCHSKITRVDKHLKFVHKLKTGSEIFRKGLASARRKEEVLIVEVKSGCALFV